jgi:hypothetical protein
MSSKAEVLIQQGANPFYRTRFWFSALHQHIFPQYRLIELTVNDTVLPHIEYHSQLKFIKLHCLHSLTNYYSPEFLPINANTSNSDTHLAAFYQKHPVTHYEMIDLSPLSANNADAVIAVLEQQHFYCEKYQLTTNWTHPAITDFDQFWQLRPKKMRNILRSKKTKLDRDQHYSIEILSEIEDPRLEQMLESYHQVYNKSWKNNEPFTQFIDDIVREENKQGRVRLGILSIKDQAVAAQIWFVHQQTAFIFKLSYDNHYRNESVGSILMEAMFQQVISKDHVTCVDFLTGDDKYKADWMTCARPLYGIKAYNKKTIKGLTCAALVWLNQQIKRLRTGKPEQAA